MNKKAAVLMAAVCLSGFTLGAGAGQQVKIETSYGDIVIALDAKAAPATVANFIAYVDSGFYNGTVFHRVIPNFMIQGGGMTADLAEKPTRPPVKNEATNGLKNLRGTVAMARTGDPHSATAQFFINLVDNAFLNHTSEDPNGWGYCVFGKVIKGMAAVDAIAKVQTTTKGSYENVPAEPVVIKKASMIAAKAVPAVKPAAVKKESVKKENTGE